MGFFGQRRGKTPYHPEEETQFPGEPTFENVEQIFSGCADFATHTVVSARTGERFRLCWLDGMVKSERLNDYVIRPLAAGPAPAELDELRQLLEGGVWNLNVREQNTLDNIAEQLVAGSAAVFCAEGVLTCDVGTEEKRSVQAPEDEVAAKGAKDSFVESLRTNTSLLRRHLRSPHIQIEEFTVGRESRTPVDIVWMEGLTNRKLVEDVERRLEQVDIDGLLSTGDFEEYVAQCKGATFPQMVFTERPDRFCRGILDGRVGVFIEGIPLGGLLPGNIAQFLQAPQDQMYHWTISGALLTLRYLCLLTTLLLPGFYIAVASFHFEMIPTKLAMSIIASKQNVPFATPFEVLLLLLAFEILQEAGLRLPKTIGQTVSIIGGLVVGQAAVDAKILSPAVVIVVAAAGIAGFTLPNQDLANALRIWRFLIALAASVAGLFGVVTALAALVCHLAGMESFGLAYLTPFAADAGQQVEGHAVFRQPIPEVKLRELSLRPENRRRQK
ncbi:MAG: spore germination protein [Clostridiales bacterium]|nr:spore germination protein [Clostridiales bacterium]